MSTTALATALATALIGATAVVAGSGCVATRYHGDRNAPGIIDVATPPQSAAAESTEQPRDPGEHMVTVNPGVLTGVGAKTARNDKFTTSVTAEVSVNWGDNPRSHYRDGFFAYPLTGWGVTLGWNALQHRAERTDTGPVYVELSRFRLLMGASVGYAIDPTDFDSGPQASAWIGPFYVQARYLLDGGAEIYTGIQLKIPFVWISSR